MTFFEGFECIDYQEVRYNCEIGFGSRGSWVRIPSPRQSFKTVGYQDNTNLKANGFFSCLDVSFPLLFVNLKKSFEHFCITLCKYVTLFSHIIHKMGCKCGFLRILYTIINAEN